MDQYIGKLLDNRHEILEIIGTGGMARVYKARDHRLNRLVAIKILREDLAQDAEFRRRFHDESQAVAMLSHPNIVAVYDVSRSSELEYIVMELIDGITLKQYMQRKGNKLNWREALHFTTQIVKALGHAHSRGIIHRDIKPHNIMVLRDGSVKVADFGIARVSSSGHSTLTQEALGSVHYISPEQARGSHIDARSDLYSAGVVLYEMITGRLPFEGDNPVSVAIQHINSIPLSPRELDPTIPEALEAITMKAMAPDPDDRYLTADDMLADLEEFRKNPNINFDYKPADILPDEPDEEDMTRRVVRPRTVTESSGRRRSSSRDSGRRSRRRYEEEEEEDEVRGSPWVVPLCVLAILLFVGAVFYFLYRTFLTSLLAPTDFYTVPSLVGHKYEEVLEDEELLGRFKVVLGETVSDEAEAGTILSQEPSASSQVTGSTTEITVTVSGGEEIIPVPDLRNKEYREAFLELDKLGLKYSYDEVTSDDVEKGHIVSCSPPEGTPVAPGTEIKLVGSKGKEVKTVPVPNLVTRTLEQALSDLKTVNLEQGELSEVFDDTIAAGCVVNQYPIAATVLDEGSKVNLQISKGPDPSTAEPDPSEPPAGGEEPGPQSPEGTGGQENEPPVENRPVTKTFQYPLPETGGIVNIQIMMDGKVVYNQDWDSNIDAFATFDLTGTGLKTVAIYVDGTFTGTKDIDFSS